MELAKSRNVLRIGELHLRHHKRQSGRRVSSSGGFKSIEGLLNGKVADRVNMRGQTAHVELSIRQWGRTDKKALEVLREIDSLRLRYIAGLFEEMGFEPSDARARALIAYSYMRVSRALIRADDTEVMMQCERVFYGTKADTVRK